MTIPITSPGSPPLKQKKWSLMIGWFLWTLACAIFSLNILLIACSSFLLYMLVTQGTIFRREEQCSHITHLVSSVTLECFRRSIYTPAVFFYIDICVDVIDR